MTNTDKELFRILNDKLDGLESSVSADVWNGVQQQMGAAGKAAAVKSGFWTSKLLMGLAAAAVITGVVVIAALNTQKETEVQNIQAPKPTINQSGQQSATAVEDTSEIVLQDAAPKVKESVVLENVSCDVVPPLEDQIIEKTTFYGTVDPGNQNDGIVENSKRANISENPNFQDEASSNAEPLSAGFHTKCVDAEELRYFFFPKTDKAQSFKWVVSDGTESREMSLAHVFEKEGIYTITLTATGYDGQITTESESVAIFKQVQFKIPTAITPGNSGKNDVIDFADAIENEMSIEYLVIRDRAGKVVYESKNAFAWNGYNMGQELCPAGVYSYVVIAIDRGNNSQTNKGTIQLFHE